MIPSPRRIVPRSVGRRLQIRRGPGVLALLVCLCFAAGPAAAQRSTPSPEQSFAEAVQLYEQRLYQQAAVAFESFRDAHPSHPSAAQALYLEARAALGLDREREAVRLFERLQADHPNHPRAREAQLSLGQYFLDQGNVDEGRRQLERIVASTPDQPQAARALYLLGEADRRQGNLQQALSRFYRVAEKHPESDVAPAAYYAAGTVQVERENYSSAAQWLESLGRRYPTSDYARNLGTALGEVYYELGRYDNAATELEARLSDLEGGSRVRALFLLAESYSQTGRTEDAVVYYRRVIDDHPQSPYVPPALYGLGRTYQRTGDFEQATAYFQEVRQVGDPALQTKAAYYQGVSYAQQGDRASARRAYRAVLEQAPDSRFAAEAQYEIGLLAYEDENYGAAAAAFRALHRNYPDSDRRGAAYYWLGNAYLARGDLDRALTAYNEATARDAAPDSLAREVQFQQAWALYENDRFADAAAAFESLSSNATGTDRGAAALFWAGDSRYQLGQMNRAQTHFRQYLDRYPDGRHAAGAQYALGWTYFKQGQYGSAAVTFQRFLNREGGIPASDVPYRQDAQLRLADSYYALKRYDDAVEQYRRVSGDGSDYALYQAGQALNFAGRPDEALRTLNRLVERYPNSPWRDEAQYRIGYIRFQQQEYTAARSAYRALIDQTQSTALAARAQYGIGDTHYNAGEMQQAARAYQRVLERYPNSASATEAASSLFFALNAIGADDRASAVIDSFATANPNSNVVQQMRFRRAEAAYQSGDRDRALRLFRQFTRTATDEGLLPEAYYYIGIIYADRGEADEAKTYLRQLVNQYPQSSRLPEAALRLGDVNMEQRNYSAANQAYATAAESAQTGEELRAQARYGESMALLQLGQTDAAGALLDRILDENRGGPLLASARLGKGRIAEQEGRVEDALGLYRQVAQQASGETGAEALYRLGALLLQEGRPRDAIRELDRMPSLFAGYPTWVAQALLAQARANRRLGQTGTAAQLYDQVIQEHAGTEYATTARREKEAL